MTHWNLFTEWERLMTEVANTVLPHLICYPLQSHVATEDPTQATYSEGAPSLDPYKYAPAQWSRSCPGRCIIYESLVKNLT